MKSFIVLLIILALGYFALSAFKNSSLVNSDTEYEQQFRVEVLGDPDKDGPVSTREALIEFDKETDNLFDKFFNPIQEQINKWRIDIKTYLDARI